MGLARGVLGALELKRLSGKIGPATLRLARGRSAARTAPNDHLQKCQAPVTIDPLAPLILTPLLHAVHSALVMPALTSPALFFCFSL